MKVMTSDDLWVPGTISSAVTLTNVATDYRFGDHAKYTKIDNTLYFACKGIPPFQIVNDGTPTGWTMAFTTFDAPTYDSEELYAYGDIVKNTTYFQALDISKDVTIKAPNRGIATSDTDYWVAFTGYIGPDFMEDVDGADYNYCPSSVTSHAGRLVYAGSPAEPMTMYGSRIRDYTAFNKGLADNAAWKHTISANDTDLIHWMISSEALICGSDAAEFVITGGAFGITPTNIQVETKTPHGSCDAQPVLYNELVLFMQSDRRQMRGYSYMDALGRYYASHMNIASSHIFQGVLRQLRLVRSPRPAVLGVLGDGELVRFDYDRQAGLMSFFRWNTTTDHTFNAIGILPAKDSEEDLVFVTAVRNGKTYLEMFSWTDYFYNTDHPKTTYSMDYGMYLDGAIEVEVKEDSVGYYADGLTDYIGIELSVVIENSQHPSKTVDATGRIELDHDGAWGLVGFPWSSKAKTVNLGPMMKVKRINQIGVRFIDTVGTSVGTSEDELETIIFREGETYYDQALPLYSGDKLVDNPGGFGSDAHVFIQQDDALPQTVLAIVPWMQVWEK